MSQRRKLPPSSAPPRRMGPKTEALLFVIMLGILIALVVYGVRA